jgi:hypothetical protein
MSKRNVALKLLSGPPRSSYKFKVKKHGGLDVDTPRPSNALKLPQNSILLFPKL